MKKVNEYYRVHHRFHSNLDFRGLKNWVQMEAAQYFSDNGHVVEMESHYYHPHRNPHIYGNDVEGVLRLEHELMSAGIQVHYSDRLLEEGEPGPNLCLMEDALIYANYRRMDVAVLFSTQGQFAPLPDRLRLMGIPTLLLGWNFVYPKAKRRIRWKTDSCLRETCAHYVAMEKVVDQDPTISAPPRGFFFQKEKPFGRGRNAFWPRRQKPGSAGTP